MKTGLAGIKLIKEFEGFRPDAYLCPAGILTIGYGHTGEDVYPDMHITQTQGEDLLESDLVKFERGLNEMLKSSIHLRQNQFDALISLAYNIGLNALSRSTIIKLINIGEYVQASNHFLDWTKAKGKVLTGLVQRRQAEIKLFLS